MSSLTPLKLNSESGNYELNQYDMLASANRMHVDYETQECMTKFLDSDEGKIVAGMSAVGVVGGVVAGAHLGNPLVGGMVGGVTGAVSGVGVVVVKKECNKCVLI